MILLRPSLVLLALTLAAPWQVPDSDPRPLGRRLAGPLSSMWAAGHWVRFDMQVHNSEMERAYLTADRALQLDPWPSAGWIRLAEHLWFIRASAEREPDPSRRAHWFAAGLRVLNEGIERSGSPGEVALVKARMTGLYLLPLVQDGAVHWPGGAAALKQISQAAYQVAREFGLDPASGLDTEAQHHQHKH